MKSKYYTGHVGDELWPNCGCGKRTVEASVGYKWVRVREAVRWPTNCKKLSRKVWDSMKMAEVDKPGYLK